MDIGTIPPRVKAAAGKLRVLLRVLSGALLLAFGWLKLRGIPFLSAVRSVDARPALQFAMALYFTSWVFGSNFDIDLREGTYVDPPTAASFRSLFPLFVSLAALFGLLCWAGTPAQFAAVLLVFWSINAGGWYWAKRKVFPRLFIRATTPLVASPAKPDPALLTEAVLEAVKRYEIGNWQAWRFAVGGLLILAINAAVVFGAMSDVTRYAAWLSADLAFSLSILCFVVIVEAWVWGWRIWVYVAVRTIRWLNTKFAISYRPGVPDTDLA
jgi:hypothetical protein